MNARIFLAILFVLVASTVREARAEPPPEVRVLVIDSIPSVTVSGAGSALKLLLPGGRGGERLGGSAHIVAGPRGLVIGGANRGEEMLISDAARRYRIGDRSFRGTLAIVWKGQGSLSVIDNIMIEDYLSGLINSEISSSWPLEAIKAQAVAARTYAMNQISGARRSATPRPYDITSTTLDQVYEGAHQEDRRSQDAVRATRGEFLLRSGAVFSAYYHSCCGGRTERAQNVWPGEKGPPPVDDSYCERSPQREWRLEIPKERFMEVLKSNGVAVTAIYTIAKTQFSDSPRAGEIIIEDDDGLKMVKATDLRRIFGYQNIKSTWFEVALQGNSIVFTGRGYGHGAGLCQWGAKGMAEAGKSHKEILKFYYPDAEIVKLY